MLRTWCGLLQRKRYVSEPIFLINGTSNLRNSVTLLDEYTHLIAGRRLCIRRFLGALVQVRTLAVHLRGGNVLGAGIPSFLSPTFQIRSSLYLPLFRKHSLEAYISQDVSCCF